MMILVYQKEWRSDILHIFKESTFLKKDDIDKDRAF